MVAQRKGGREGLPSLLQAATDAVKQARMPTVRTESLMFVWWCGDGGKRGATPLKCRRCTSSLVES